VPQFRIGAGSAYANDRLEPAQRLADSGLVDYMAFDCLAERTLALAQVRAMADPTKGQDERIDEVVGRFSSFLSKGGKIVGNFGSANVEAGLRDVLDGLRDRGITGTRVGVVYGDNVMQAVKSSDLELPELGLRISDLGDRLISAHAYIGAEEIKRLLEQDAAFILGGRLADPSLYVAPICHDMGWDLDMWDEVAAATLVGHLLECGVHVTGGNFADPPYRVVNGLDDLALPFAVGDGSDMMVTKLPGTGGLVSGETIRAQLGYEIHDPARYITPDVVADFTNTWVDDLGNDRVRVGGAVGSAQPELLKVLVGVHRGWKSVGEVSFAGPGCVARGKLAAEMIRARLESIADDIDEIRYDLHGYSAVFGERPEANDPIEVRLRVAARCRTPQAAKVVNDEVEFMYMGPAGGGGIAFSVVPAIGVTPAFIPRSQVTITSEVVTS